MALLKDITLPVGIVLKYHRIASFDIVTNAKVSMTVISYLSKEAREEEKQYLLEKSMRFTLMAKDTKDLTAEDKILLSSPEPTMSVYQDSRIITMPYTEEMSVSEAYEYLKTLPEFEGGIDD